MKHHKYQMLIQWSDEDGCFVVSLPNFPEINQPCTDEMIYAEAAQQGQEIIESLSLWYQPEGKNCIHPRTLKA